jgi:futalosine hydrolase
MILVIAATEFEIAPFLAKEHRHVDTLVTGVGAASTLYHLQKRLHQIDYDLVIQAGIAGTFNNAIELGETVLVKQDSFADIGIEEKENFTTIFKAGFADANEFPFEEGWLINKNELLHKLSLPLVKAVTVNKVSDSLLQKQQLISTFDPQVESMEGAALHYVCLQEKVSFLQLRSISNEVGERDKSKWKIKEAINNLNKELLKLIKEVGSQRSDI